MLLEGPALMKPANVLVLSIILVGLATVTTGYPDCICTCVNGENVALCSDSFDIEPICPPKICPIDVPSVSPIERPMIPPIGTDKCSYERVQNPKTGRYEWKTICR